jgi:CubicO group peptidase (beta-lactamase class C family)
VSLRLHAIFASASPASASTVALAVALLAGCSHGGVDPEFPTGPAAPAPGPEDGSHIQNVACSIPIEKGRMSLAEAMQRFGVPGVSAAAMVGGKVVWATGWGLADREHQIPMTPETILQAASISKAVTSVGILRMVQAGELNLDEDVSDSIDWEAKWHGQHAKITLRELLSHSAGLTVHGFNGYPLSKKDQLPKTIEVLEGKGNSPRVALESPPGTATDYSGGGFVVAQAVVEEKLDEKFSDAMYEWLIKPFGLRRSTFEQPLSDDKVHFAAHGYSNGQLVKGGYHVYPEGAAAGFWTTPTDLLVLAAGIIRAYHGQPAPLSQGMAFAMLTPTSADGHFGIGFAVKKRGNVTEAWHNGGNKGFSSMFVWDTEGNGAAAIVNGEGPIANAVVQSIGEEYGWRHSKEHGCPK